MSELKKLVEKWRSTTGMPNCMCCSTGNYCNQCQARLRCADELEAALAAQPQVSEEQVRKVVLDLSWIPLEHRHAVLRNLGISLSAPATPAPTPRPDGCICSEAYGVGPEQCGRHDLPAKPAPCPECHFTEKHLASCSHREPAAPANDEILGSPFPTWGAARKFEVTNMNRHPNPDRNKLAGKAIQELESAPSGDGGKEWAEAQEAGEQVAPRLGIPPRYEPASKPGQRD